MRYLLIAITIGVLWYGVQFAYGLIPLFGFVFLSGFLGGLAVAKDRSQRINY